MYDISGEGESLLHSVTSALVREGESPSQVPSLDLSLSG